MLVFCTTVKGRTQHLAKTLPKNILDNHSNLDHKFLILDYNSQDNLQDYLKTNYAKEIDSGKVVVYSFKGTGPFRMAHAKNMAHRLGMLEGGDILVNLDADNYTGEDFVNYIYDKFAQEDSIFLWARMVKGDYARGISGRIVTTANAFTLVGGYDEKYSTWSPDDKDFNARLRRLGFIGHEIPKQFLDAVNHNDNMRFKEYQHIKDTGSEGDFQIDTEATIVNYGRIGHGMVYKNYGDEPINIGPIPTKIFGIGMHKTGTTSLHYALKTLGYDSAHWKNAHWAKAIYEEMITYGKSKTLEKNYALCDLPIPLLYQSLDIAYPGSKFILTIRDENDWLNSVENHWLHELNPFRKLWDKDPFTHKVHKLLYGCKNFDKEVFIQRYRKHNAEVMKYFKCRSSDLLVLDECKWSKLCQFLDKSIPSVAYPHHNSV